MGTTHQTVLSGKSVAESSVAFVILSAGILITVFAVSAIIWFIFLDKGNAPETQRRIFFAIVWGLWAFLSIGLWRGMLSRMRARPNLDLSDDGFFKFQVASALFVLAFWLLLCVIPNDVPGVVSAVRIVFESLLILFTLTYLSFAWAAKKSVPTKIYVGLLINVVVVATAQLR